ncbi:MAG: 6-hydroxymethylpterin diphosphokinase MptE-like protein [candidate division WOR-3 bacterium]
MDNDSYLKFCEKNLSENIKSGIFVDRENIISLVYLIRNLRDDYLYALFINPSPTLEEHIEDIKKFLQINRDKVVLFCSDVCLSGLLSIGIEPDYVVSLDISDKTVRYLIGHNFKYNLVCPTFFPIYRVLENVNNVYVFNSVEENEYFRIPNLNSSPEKLPEIMSKYYTEGIRKSEVVNSLLREAKIYKRYPSLLARGTVFITMYQIECRIKLYAGFYGSSLTVKKNKPYASFISEANYYHISKVDPSFKELVPSVEEYNRRVLLSYFNNDESLMNTYFSDVDGDTYVQPPVLKFYQDLLRTYSMLDELPRNKTVIFR